ncbi:hypothetical protein [Streptomyces sp. NPDC059009]|uniref:hypothetical protein n=1 Tax=Streptomyces sp. NPDC059009 TaxID=3346694 RepID=UPI00368B5F9A
MSEQDQAEEQQSGTPRDKSRVTADLPPREYEFLDDARVLNAASTTDLMRAMLRLHNADPDFAQRVTDEIGRIRREKLESRDSGRIWRRRRGRKATQTGEELSVA